MSNQLKTAGRCPECANDPGTGRRASSVSKPTPAPPTSDAIAPSDEAIIRAARLMASRAMSQRNHYERMADSFTHAYNERDAGLRKAYDEAARSFGELAYQVADQFHIPGSDIDRAREIAAQGVPFQSIPSTIGMDPDEYPAQGVSIPKRWTFKRSGVEAFVCGPNGGGWLERKGTLWQRTLFDLVDALSATSPPHVADALDGERLDYMQANPGRISGGSVFRVDRAAWFHVQGIGYFPSVRDAIDAARAEAESN